MSYTFITSADAVFMASAGASATATGNSDFMEWANERAEAWVNAFTGVNWHDVFSGLDAETKFLLGEIAGSKMAIDIIRYDSAGYLDGFDAQLNIDILTDNITKGIARLNETITKELLGQQ